MRLAELTRREMTEALDRGWARLDSRAAVQLQGERAGVELRATPGRIAAILDERDSG